MLQKGFDYVVLYDVSDEYHLLGNLTGDDCGYVETLKNYQSLNNHLQIEFVTYDETQQNRGFNFTWSK